MLKNDKGITFNIITETEAVDYLKNINNYLRTASYRKNYEKYTLGENEGKYINLDFAYLAELSSIDMYLRKIAFQMCADIEHAIKTRLITNIENNPDENGYDIVDVFLSKNTDVLENIEGKSGSVFTGGLIEKYFTLCYVYDKNEAKKFLKTRILKCECPVWVLVEIITFGDLIKLISLYNEIYPNHIIDIPSKNILQAVKSLRNACAHNNCLLNNMNKGETKPPVEISQYISEIQTIGKEERIKKLSCRPMFEFVCMLKTYNEVVSESVRKRGLNDLKIFVNEKMYRNIQYFDKNIVVKTSFDFLKKVIDNCI